MPGIKEINTIRYIYIILLAALSGSCQKGSTNPLVKINTLSNDLREISGISLASDQSLYAINDSGNDNTLFRLDQKGNIIQKIKVPNTVNIDWEDLAFDQKNNIYIGDFGNNANDRKDLAIYKVSNPLSKTIAVSKIEFVFADQKKFPPKKKKCNYDVEAFIHLDQHLYLFTKNRGDYKKGVTTVYKIPSSPGKHIAIRIGEITTCKDQSDCLITGAAITRSGSKIALLTHNKIFLLSNYNRTDLSGAETQKVKLFHTSQKEGICFKNDSTLLITDEKKGKQKAGLYEYQLPQ